MEIHELIATEAVSKYESLISALPAHLREYGHHVLFTLQNCHYNKNRIREAVQRWNDSPSTLHPQGAELLKARVPEGKALNMAFPVIIWDYIPLFELHAFVSNTICCCNHLAQIAAKLNGFKLKNKDHEIDIRQYAEIYPAQTDSLTALLTRNYPIWISSLDSKRDVYLHRLSERQLKGTLKWKFANRQGTIVLESKVEIISEFGEIIEFCAKTIKLLEELIIQFKELLPTLSRTV